MTFVDATTIIVRAQHHEFYDHIEYVVWARAPNGVEQRMAGYPDADEAKQMGRSFAESIGVPFIEAD